jgi:excisionase family DNA binding protein
MAKFVKIGSEYLLTSSEVGSLLQVNPSSVKKWVDDGLLVAFRTPGGHRRIRATDLVEFLVRHRMPIPTELSDAGRKRVLLVDDNAVQLSALSRSLKRHADRLEVVTANNGIDALVLVGSFHPHFIVLDIFMPEIDGLEVCRRLKKRNETRDVQVVVVSGGLTPALERKALEAGAVRCLPKPIDVQALLGCVLAPMADVRRAVVSG